MLSTAWDPCVAPLSCTWSTVSDVWPVLHLDRAFLCDKGSSTAPARYFCHRKSNEAYLLNVDTLSWANEASYKVTNFKLINTLSKHLNCEVLRYRLRRTVHSQRSAKGVVAWT